MKDIECPYCGHEQDINHDDGYGYQEGIKHQIQCHECEKTYVFETHISFHYEAEKADCLNDDKHDFQLTHTIPIEASEMRCTMCDKERHLTDQERKEFGIGTLEDYFKSL